MQAQQQDFANAKPPINGPMNALLRNYANERTGLVGAIAKAKKFLTGNSYEAASATMDRNSKEAAPMLQALMKNQLSNVRWVLQGGFDANTLLTNEVSNERVSLIHVAQSALAVRLLLDGGANPNASPDVMMSNPLTAVIKGMAPVDRIESVDTLLQAGADPNAGVGFGAAPLAAAVTRPDIGVTMLLIEAGAQVDRHVILAAIQSHNERAHRISKDSWQIQMNMEETRKVVDLLVYASEETELKSILKDPEVSRLLKLTPDVADLFDERLPEVESGPSLKGMTVN